VNVQSKSAKRPVVPTLESVSPEYCAIVQKSRELGALLAAKHAELRQVSDELGNHPFTPVTAPADVMAKAARISALLGEAPPHASAEPARSTGQLKIAELQAEMRDITAALELLVRRRTVAARDASRLICQQMRGEHANRAKVMIQAVLNLHQANLEYTAFADAMDEQRVAWGELGPVFPTFAGAPNDPFSNLATFLHEAIDDGHIKQSDLPNEFR